MPELTNPENGDHVWVSPEMAETLIADGWDLLPTGFAVAESDPSDLNVADDESDESDADDEIEDDDESGDDFDESPPVQLDKMKLTELIAHAETIGVPADQIAPLRKPGASKAQAIEIIAAHAAA